MCIRFLLVAVVAVVREKGKRSDGKLITTSRCLRKTEKEREGQYSYWLFSLNSISLLLLIHILEWGYMSEFIR